MKTQKKSKILTYTAIFEEAEEGGYFVYVPSLPGCLSEGDSYEEARANIADAISLYLEDVSYDNALEDSSSHILVDTIQISKPTVTL
ncbi:MAG TPA: type II toxin-antitoxin system HicB family antitoxin [Patescibacteria group bacterium]|nr:type II toxin-antitoxin system HicB family antitoxin [Patescibacteria group bacterium]